MLRVRTEEQVPPHRLHLVRGSSSVRYGPLAMWHLLSLDAPSVAVLWMLQVARSAGIALPMADACAMFTAVWMLYAADRLLDAAPLAQGFAVAGLEARHYFHHRYRRVFLTAMVLAAGALAGLLVHLAGTELRLFAALAALLAGWLLLVHSLSAERSHRLPKELAVGVFFSAAVFVPTLARAPEWARALLPHALCFAALCTLNCLFLYSWEHPGARRAAHRSTRAALHVLVPLSLLTLTLALFLCVLTWRHALPGGSRMALLPLAIAASVLLLLGLHQARYRLAPVPLRALADAALLTPGLALLWSVLHGIR